ncbi:unnamed protein product [Heterobilharzia americana]|nr:unnamed protein product [Heterobilharzia americana]
MWRYLLRFTRLDRHRVSRLLNTQCNSQTSPTFIKTLSFAIPFAWWPFEFLKEKDVHEQIRQSFNDCLFLIAKGEFKEADDKLHELLYFANQSYQNKQLTDLDCRKAHQTNNGGLFNRGLSPNDSVFVELSLKMALIFEKSDRMTDAETGFRFCIQTQEEKLTNMDEDIDCTNEKALLGMCCNYFAKFLFTNRRPTEALVYAQRAYNIASQIYPLDHPNCLNILIDISAIQVDLNQFKESQHTLEQVIEASQTRYQSFTDEYKIDPNLLKSNYSKQYEIYQILYTLIHSLLQLAVVKIMSNNQESVKQLLLQANQILDQSRQMGLKTSMHRKQIDDFIVEHHV